MGLFSNLFKNSKPASNIQTPANKILWMHGRVTVFSDNSFIIDTKSGNDEFMDGDILNSRDKLYLGCGSLMQSDNLDDAIALFDDNGELLFYKKCPEPAACRILPNQCIFICSDECALQIIDFSGKSVFRKNCNLEYSNEACFLTDEYFYICGVDSKDALSVFCLDFNLRSLCSKSLIKDFSAFDGVRSFSLHGADNGVVIDCSDGQSFFFSSNAEQIKG